MMSSPAAQSRTDLPCVSITWKKLLFSSAALTDAVGSLLYVIKVVRSLTIIVNLAYMSLCSHMHMESGNAFSDRKLYLFCYIENQTKQLQSLWSLHRAKHTYG